MVGHQHHTGAHRQPLLEPFNDLEAADGLSPRRVPKVAIQSSRNLKDAAIPEADVGPVPCTAGVDDGNRRLVVVDQGWERRVARDNGPVGGHGREKGG